VTPGVVHPDRPLHRSAGFRAGIRRRERWPKRPAERTYWRSRHTPSTGLSATTLTTRPYALISRNCPRSGSCSPICLPPCSAGSPKPNCPQPSTAWCSISERRTRGASRRVPRRNCMLSACAGRVPVL
jgi:hypothetical protein